MTTPSVRELRRLSAHGTTAEESRRAALHERQVSYVQASLLHGIRYERTGESGRSAARR
jgi:hypothetical protein